MDLLLPVTSHHRNHCHYRRRCCQAKVVASKTSVYDLSAFAISYLLHYLI